MDNSLENPSEINDKKSFNYGDLLAIVFIAFGLILGAILYIFVGVFNNNIPDNYVEWLNVILLGILPILIMSLLIWFISNKNTKSKTIEIIVLILVYSLIAVPILYFFASATFNFLLIIPCLLLFIPAYCLNKDYL